MFEDNCYLSTWGSINLYHGIDLNADLLINKSNLVRLISLLADKGEKSH